MVGGGATDGGKLGGEALDRALRVHDLADRDAGEVELHGERLGEQPRVALGDTGTAAGADLDLDDAERLQRAQRVARHDPAHPEPPRQVLLSAEKVTRPHLLGEQCLTHLGDDSRRQRRPAEGEDLARLDGWMQPHKQGPSKNMIKIISFSWYRQVEFSGAESPRSTGPWAL